MKAHFRTLKTKVVIFILYRTFYKHAAAQRNAAARVIFACPECVDSTPKSVREFAENWEFRGQGWLEGSGVLFWRVFLFRFCVILVYITSFTPLHIILSLIPQSMWIFRDLPHGVVCLTILKSSTNPLLPFNSLSIYGSYNQPVIPGPLGTHI